MIYEVTTGRAMILEWEDANKLNHFWIMDKPIPKLIEMTNEHTFF